MRKRKFANPADIEYIQSHGLNMTVEEISDILNLETNTIVINMPKPNEQNTKEETLFTQNMVRHAGTISMSPSSSMLSETGLKQSSDVGRKSKCIKNCKTGELET